MALLDKSLGDASGRPDLGDRVAHDVVHTGGAVELIQHVVICSGLEDFQKRQIITLTLVFFAVARISLRG
jgi:hypothetical protein